MKTLRILRHSASRLFQPSAFRLSGFFLAAFSLQAFSPSAFAQSPSQTATVQGRVLNVANGQYLKNAEVRVAGSDNYVYTDEDGSYAIRVPAGGTVELAASYTGVRSATASIAATPEGPNVLNFDLQPVIVDAAAASDATGPVVLLDRFVVTTDREGQAKAIMDQRAAMNAVTIIAADNFGDVTMGSLGEVLKYMPGISLEYDNAEATGARIGGLPTKYTTAALDGIAVSTSGRAINLVDFSSTGIETIEFVQTLTAGMDASAGAGRLNLTTKDPFSRRGRQLRYRIGLNGHSDGTSLGGSYMPDDRKHNLVLPSTQINYGGVFFNRRLAIEANFSQNGSFSFAQAHYTYYSYRNPDPVVNPGIDFASTEPVIGNLMWIALPSIVNNYAGNLNAAYKLTHGLTLSVRGGFTQVENEYFVLRSFLRAYSGDTSGGLPYSPTSAINQIDSTLTHWVVNGLGDNKSRLVNEYDHRKRHSLTLFATPRLTYKRGSFNVDLYGGYTGNRKHYRDTDHGFFRSSNSYFSNVSWVADRPSASSPTWTITQTGGDPWNVPENWSKRDYYGLGIMSYPDHYDSKQYVGGLDAACALRVLGAPVTLKAGGLWRRNDYSHRGWLIRYNYLGPTGRPQEAPLPYTQNYLFKVPLGGKAGNISEQGWRVDDTYAIYRIFQEHPDWFTDTIDSLRRELIGRQDLNETINAGYFEVTGRVNRLRYNAGMRAESTEVESQQIRRRTAEEVTAAGHPVGSDGNATTEAGMLYQYYDRERFPRNNRYTNLFFSGGFKYEITKNLQAQLSASQSILRPDYDNLSGTVNYDEDLTIIRIPNATLKPEYMTKYYAGLNWRLEPAGTLSLSAYRMDIKDKQIGNMQITREQAESIIGYPLAGAVGGGDGAGDETGGGEDLTDTFFFYTTINSPSRLSVYGLTLEYSQQLTFLPGGLKGLSVFSSMTFSSIHGSQIDEDRIGQLKRSANGGIRYRYARFYCTLRGSWNGSSLAGVTRPGENAFYFLNDHLYAKSRLIVDLSGGFRLSNRYELTFSVRNITNAPTVWYSNVSDRLYRHSLGGSYWNVSLQGNF